MATRYLDNNGLAYLWGKIKTAFTQLLTDYYTKSEVDALLSPIIANVTTDFTGNITSDAPLKVLIGSSLTINLTLGQDERKIKDITVTMSDVDVTSSAFNASTNQININNVTGNVSIVAVAVPYDAEVEYLRSTPTARIDTGLTDIDKFEMKFRVSAFTAYAAIFGNYKSENHNVWRLIMDSSSSSTNLILCMNTKANGGGTRVPIGERGVDHTLVASLDAVIADGVPVENIVTTTGTSNNTEIVLFSRDKNLASIPELYTRIYYFKAWKNGTLLRDFIPVRVGQVGYMYDKVSGQLFGNAGSGTFIYGNDK